MEEDTGVYDVASVPEASGDGGEFFCVKPKELSYGKKIKDSLFPCDCESREVLTLLCQGKMFSRTHYHCPAHCGHSLTFFHMLSWSFSCDLWVFVLL
ncbi:unnamed protein product [Tetraodon nigroviridis]|uniref:(spotted green pufferfish) hypothetical protein n=1 Tax=Tetraodon nigroviridis TaxID=99883 RepID=Q4RFF9_TETNG|nr:unnamed protein product [Tetraodon nigroviridis]